MEPFSSAFSLVTWNINSIRTRLPHILRWATAHKPTVLCFQETKVNDELFPLEELEGLGYEVLYCGQPRYNGVAIASLWPIEAQRLGFEGDNSDEEKRFMVAKVGGVTVVNVYVPQGQTPESPHFEKKLRFLARLEAYFKAYHRPEEAIACVGDFNIAPHPEDVYSPEAMKDQVSFHPTEKAALSQVQAFGFEDLFRQYEKGAGFYSWWDYRQGAFRRDHGLRIDHIWTTASLLAKAESCHIDKSERSQTQPSDHVPVYARFRLAPKGGVA